MIAALLGDAVLRQIPAALAAGVQSGQYQVYGSIIKSCSTGQIIGHLQETSGLAQLAGGLPVTPAGAIAGLAMGGIQIAQNEQIKSGLVQVQAGLQALQQLGIANLALGAAGIGVSVAGFAVLGRKIDAVKQEVAALSDRIDRVGAIVEDLRRDLVQSDLDRLRTAALAMDEAWSLGPMAAERQWHLVAEESLQLSVFFERRARELLAAVPEGLALSEPMLDAFAMALGLRVAARIAAGEDRAAQIVAIEGARSLMRLTGQIGLADLALPLARRSGVKQATAEWGKALAEATEQVRSEITRIREREAAAATRAAPLLELERRQIKARDWLAAAREEKDSPILLLPCEAELL